jgi:CheY-like chemotaxis protein/HPt (histidine-containing phosphotransfer) domain-containing protein/anti-sigma regulatory factor (Ser/Thr protein kinase)
MRVRQVLLNLLANAVKFTEKGEILITTKTVEETGDRISVEIAVSDTGIGIPEDKLDTIFEPFTQADGSTTRKYGGTGLGLTISQRLARMMDGEIKVESREGKGSVFRFNLRLKKGPAEADLDKGPAVPGGLAEEQGTDRALKILLAEDDPANQKMTMLMLRKMGHTVELAEDGVKAVEMAKAQAYDIILMDMQMPNMGGLEATWKLRRAGVKTPIVAMTASAMKGDRERFLEAGVDDYIAKPIKRDIVRDTLNRYVDLKPGPDIPGPDQVTLPSAETIAEELGLDQEEYWEILTAFIEDKKRDMEDLGRALALGDKDRVFQLAHKIKGSALNLRLESLARYAANIEKAAKEGDLSGISGDWDALDLEFKALGERGKRDGDGARV